MFTALKSYLDIILTERSWSWTVIGILYLIAAWMIRLWFMSPLVGAAKKLERTLWRDIRDAYFKRSLAGWIFYLIPLAILIAFWYRNGMISVPSPAAMLILFLAAASFIFSILLHLKAFALASITILGEAVDKATGRSVSSLE